MEAAQDFNKGGSVSLAFRKQVNRSHRIFRLACCGQEVWASDRLLYRVEDAFQTVCWLVMLETELEVAHRSR